MSKKKGTTVPLEQFLKPDTKITSWAEEDDFDADRRLSAIPWLKLHSKHVFAADRKKCNKTVRPDSNFETCLAVPAAPLPARPDVRPAAAAEPAPGPYDDLPDRPPYKVYIGNVPYELQQGDVADFFQGLQVKKSRMAAHVIRDLACGPHATAGIAYIVVLACRSGTHIS